MSRIVLIAATLTGNQGAEAMLSAAIGRLSEARPDARFTVMSYYPKADRALMRQGIEVLSATPLALVARHLPGTLIASILPQGMRTRAPFLPVEVRRIAEADALVDLAGVSFIDGRAKFLPFNILTLFAALLLRTPVVKFSQAIGPCEGRLMRIAARMVLSRCARIFARGQGTCGHLDALGLQNVKPAPDVAFLLRDGDRLAALPPEGAEEPRTWLAAERAAGRLVVGICPSALVYQALGAGYVTLIAETARRLLVRGVAVLLFPNATRVGSAKPRNNDLAALAAIRDAFAADGNPLDGDGANWQSKRKRLFILDRRTDAEELKVLIAGLDLAVVSRFHAMIGALASATPPVVLGWGHKYHEVMAEFGMEEFVLDAAEAVNGGAKAIESLVVDALARRTQSREAIRAQLPEIEAAAAIQIAHVAGLLPFAPDRARDDETGMERPKPDHSTPANVA